MDSETHEIAARVALANVLELLKVEAPEKM